MWCIDTNSLSQHKFLQVQGIKYHSLGYTQALSCRPENGLGVSLKV